VHHHELLSSEFVVAHSSSLLAAVWHVDFPAVQLRCWLRGDHRIAMVPGTEGLLLCNGGSWLRDCSSDYSSAGAPGDSTTHSIPDAAANASTDSTRHTLGAS